MIDSHHFTLLGNGSYSNRGCEAIVRGTASVLRQEFGKCRFSSIYLNWEKEQEDKLNEYDSSIVHYPITPITISPIRRFSPGWFSRKFQQSVYGEIAEISRFYRQIEQALQANRTHAILLAGGDNITPGPGGSPEKALRILHIARQQNVPVVFWGASIGPFAKNPDFEIRLVEELRNIDLICARESSTYNYLASLGLQDKLRLVADPAFYLEPEPSHLPSHIVSLLEESCIGLNFSPLVGRTYASSEEWVTRVRSAIEQLAHQHTGPILLIPHVLKKNSSDLDFMQTALKEIPLAQRNNVFLIEQKLNAAQNKWLIGKMQLLAGARTHTTIAALSSGVPTLFIGYSSKARGIAHDTYDQLDWFVDGTDFVPEELVSKILAMLDQLPKIRTQVEQKRLLFRERALHAATELRSLIR